MTTRHRTKVREARRASLVETRRVDLVRAATRLAEVGRVLSASNEEKLRTAQQAIEAVLSSLADQSGTEQEKEARRGNALRLAEAYSAAASDAGTGAYLLSNLLDLMGNESDEPGELAVLNSAYMALSQWISMEVSTIGSPEDVEDSQEMGGFFDGWESARKRIQAAGGIASPEAAAAEPAKCSTCEGSGKIMAGNRSCPDCNGTGNAKETKEAAEPETPVEVGIPGYTPATYTALAGETVECPSCGLMNATDAKFCDQCGAALEAPEDMPDMPKEARRRRESIRIREGRRIVTDLVPLTEAMAVREDGTTGLKLIAPGWGSTGYYSPEVLESGAGVFPAGTKMFWDHPTVTEEWERPERSLRDLAAETIDPAVWDAEGPAGPGLYANARVFSPYREVLNEIAPSIGVSIVAYGKAEAGTAEGKSGQLITELVAADSVDFVTYPGAGGAVLPILEAARQRLGIQPPKIKEATQMDEVEKHPKFIETARRAARAEEQIVLREAKDVIATKLAESELPEITRKRLASQLEANPPSKDGKLDSATLTKRVEEAIVAETEYLAGLSQAGRIRGMGSSTTGEPDLTKAVEAAFVGLGHSEAGAKIAAAGRS